MQAIFFIVYIFEAIIAYIYFSDIYKIKRSYLFNFVILFSLYIIAFFVNIICENKPYINEVFFFIVNLVYGVLCFNISLKACVFHSVFISTLMFLTELVTQALASVVFNIPIDAYRNSLSALIIIAAISKILYLFICKIISYCFSYKKHYYAKNNRTTSLFLYPMMVTATLMTFLYASTKYSFSKGLNVACAAISTLSLLFCCFIFIYNQRIQKQEAELMNLQALKQKDELNKTFYQLLEQKNEEQRVLTHDIKHHLFAISSMNDLSEIKNYISSINPELEEYQYIGRTNNKMFDLVLNKYYLLAKSESIVFETNIRASNLSFIEDNDLVSLLGNLLDNAFEAVKTSEKKSISLSTNNEPSFVILSIVNSCSSAPIINNDKLISTKQDKNIHGYGTKSIEKTAEKYNGICQWNYDESEKEFYYNILFNK